MVMQLFTITNADDAPFRFADLPTELQHQICLEAFYQADRPYIRQGDGLSKNHLRPYGLKPTKACLVEFSPPFVMTDATYVDRLPFGIWADDTPTVPTANRQSHDMSMSVIFKDKLFIDLSEPWFLPRFIGDMTLPCIKIFRHWVDRQNRILVAQIQTLRVPALLRLLRQVKKLHSTCSCLTMVTSLSYAPPASCALVTRR